MAGMSWLPASVAGIGGGIRWGGLHRMNSDRPMQDLKPTVWIGKQGCTETMVEEIKAQLKKRRLVKVKWLHNTDLDPEAIAYRAGADLIEVRGRTMVLAPPQKKRTSS
jgi:RNA-binding protein